jgi:hypothetical protein
MELRLDDELVELPELRATIGALILPRSDVKRAWISDHAIGHQGVERCCRRDAGRSLGTSMFRREVTVRSARRDLRAGVRA